MTTIDASIQYSVEKILDEEGIQKGAVVVLHAASERFLPWHLGPNMIGIALKITFMLLVGLLNRAISDFTHLGSVWKPVIMAWLWKAGVLTMMRMLSVMATLQWALIL